MGPKSNAGEDISIHALREEVDLSHLTHFGSFRLFLSTPSARRATPADRFYPALHWYFYPRPPRGGRRTDLGLVRPSKSISIHALREEGD